MNSISNRPISTLPAIQCGTISVGNLGRAVALYEDALKLRVRESGTIGAKLAASWQAPLMQGARYALLAADNQPDRFVRLVETPIPPKSHAAATYGWTAFEFTVHNVFALADKLIKTDFDIIGPPKKVDGFSAFIPMQVKGPNGEVLFLNQVLENEPDTDLPKATAWVDHIFIAVLAAKSRQSAIDSMSMQLGIDKGESHTIRYSFINNTFGLAADTKHTLSMLKTGRKPLIQIDQYPESARPREAIDGHLVPGNSIVTMVINSLAAMGIPDDAIQPKQPGLLYDGNRSACLQGPGGALIELIENRRQDLER